MSTLAWIAISGVAMSLLALTGSVTLVLPRATFKRDVLPLVALAAGPLLGGALFHMLPESVDAIGNDLVLYAWVGVGVFTFFVLSSTCTGTTATAPSPSTVRSATSSCWPMGSTTSSAASPSARRSSSTPASGSSRGSWQPPTRFPKISATSASSYTAGGAGSTLSSSTWCRP